MSDGKPDKVYRGIQEIAERIAESEDCTWRLLRDRILPAYQHKKRGPWRMSESDYRAYLASITRKPAA